MICDGHTFFEVGDSNTHVLSMGEAEPCYVHRSIEFSTKLSSYVPSVRGDGHSISPAVELRDL